MATPADAARSRSFTAELTWERHQEHALEAFRTGDATSARSNWAKALEIAERHFERGDPRIAASLNNHAFALVRREQIHQANTCFSQAMIAWEESWRWIPWMAPSTKPGELEAAPYDKETQEGFYALIRRGRDITEKLWRENQLSEAEGDDWAAVKPKTMTDIRRLFSAVFLMPTARDRGLIKRGRHHAA